MSEGELSIHLLHAAATIQIKIQDQGRGMSQEQINRLGEPYFTTENTGTGLGMMVSYSVIKSMDGTIYVSSVQGKGPVSLLTFRFMPMNLCNILVN